MSAFRFQKKMRFSELFALSGYALYSVYACMLFHSPTALSSVAPFGGVMTFWFLIALLVGRVGGYLVFLLFPSRRVIERHLKPTMAVVLGLSVLGFVVVGMAMQLSPALPDVSVILPWLCSGAIVLGVADAIVVLCLLSRLTLFGLRGTYLFLVVSNVAAVLVYYALTFLPSAVAFPLAAAFFFLAFGSLLFSWKNRSSICKSEYSRPVYRGALSRLWRPTLGVSILGFMAGLMLQISGREEIALEAFQQSSVFASLVLYVALLVIALVIPKDMDLGRIYQIAIPISAVSFLLLPLVWNSAGGIVNSFANLGFMLALLVLTCLVIEVVRDMAVSSFLLLGMVYAAAYLAQLAGMLVGYVNAANVGRGTLTLTAIALVAVYLLSVVSLALFKDKGFRGFDVDGGSVQGVAADGGGYEDRCDDIAEAYRFTEREREILRHLGQGNTIHAVSERLYISESTVKYHVKSMYQKLGIHSRQELIDVISNKRSDSETLL